MLQSTLSYYIPHETELSEIDQQRRPSVYTEDPLAHYTRHRLSKLQAWRKEERHTKAIKYSE